MMLLIKGTAEQAIEACANHALPIDITSIRPLAPTETLCRVEEGFERTVQDWFLESASQVRPPYPPGTLLHYSDERASARLVNLGQEGEI